jgi:hypothetical protein
MGAKYDLNENIHLLDTDGDKTFTKSWLSDSPTVRRCRGKTHQSAKLKFEMGKIHKISDLDAI